MILRIKIVSTLWATFSLSGKDASNLALLTRGQVGQNRATNEIQNVTGSASSYARLVEPFSIVQRPLFQSQTRPKP